MQKTQTTKDLLDTARTVPGIEVSDVRADASSRYIRSFHTDQGDDLLETLRKSRREEVLVSETADGERVGIYRRPRGK